MFQTDILLKEGSKFIFQAIPQTKTTEKQQTLKKQKLGSTKLHQWKYPGFRRKKKEKAKSQGIQKKYTFY